MPCNKLIVGLSLPSTEQACSFLTLPHFQFLHSVDMVVILLLLFFIPEKCVHNKISDACLVQSQHTMNGSYGDFSSQPADLHELLMYAQNSRAMWSLNPRVCEYADPLSVKANPCWSYKTYHALGICHYGSILICYSTSQASISFLILQVVNWFFFSTAVCSKVLASSIISDLWWQSHQYRQDSPVAGTWDWMTSWIWRLVVP